MKAALGAAFFVPAAYRWRRSEALDTWHCTPTRGRRTKETFLLTASRAENFKKMETFRKLGIITIFWTSLAQIMG
jgi:hypothetical protein